MPRGRCGLIDATQDDPRLEWWRCTVCQMLRNLRTGLTYETATFRQVPDPHSS